MSTVGPVHRKVVPDKLVTLTSWDARDFLVFLVMVGWNWGRMLSRMELWPLDVCFKLHEG